MAGIFKAYDIRGVVGKELTKAIAYKLGRAFVTFFKKENLPCKNVVVGRDIRMHTEPLFAELVRGLTEQGANVIDIGQVSTPMSYFANGHLKADASIMITASHNSAEWNGFKLCKKGAEPISGDTGIQIIAQIIKGKKFAKKPAKPGVVQRQNVLVEYAKHVAKFARPKRPLHIAIDFANGMGIWEAEALKGLLTWDALYDTPDGWFPNHAADPLTYETLVDLQKKLRNNKGKYAFGVAFDGDADRAGFVDENGERISGDLITALIALDMIETGRGKVFLYDVRCSWAVKAEIEKAGGKAIMCTVGHAGIKQKMRKNRAIFAGEVSAHYYFKDNFVAESQAMAILTVASIVEKKGEPLSKLIQPLRDGYCSSGEENSYDVTWKKEDLFKKLRKEFPGGRMLKLDGLSIEFKNDWWFNVRCSNTEPIVRLNLEVKHQDPAEAKRKMEELRDRILAIIRKK